jgi:hypothetical protein
METKQPIQFKVNLPKMVETITYLANHVPGLTIRQLYALLYISDKTSLEQYGRFIYGETYYATRQGVVPLYASMMVAIVQGKDYATFNQEWGD